MYFGMRKKERERKLYNYNGQQSDNDVMPAAQKWTFQLACLKASESITGVPSARACARHRRYTQIPWYLSVGAVTKFVNVKYDWVLPCNWRFAHCNNYSPRPFISGDIHVAPRTTSIPNEKRGRQISYTWLANLTYCSNIFNQIFWSNRTSWTNCDQLSEYTLALNFSLHSLFSWWKQKGKTISHRINYYLLCPAAGLVFEKNAYWQCLCTLRSMDSLIREQFIEWFYHLTSKCNTPVVELSRKLYYICSIKQILTSIEKVETFIL